MQIVVNHVTRMEAPRICVAGFEARELEHVRPTTPPTDPITRKLLREEGGPFGMGAVVDLGAVASVPSPPEVEDHRFKTANARHLMFGLARAYKAPHDDRERHWLQLNGICLGPGRWRRSLGSLRVGL
jgi:hypothetical protein